MGNKVISRILAVFMAVTMIFTSGIAVFAADSPTEGKVGRVISHAEQNERKITIKWTAVDGATKYIVKVGKKTKTVTGLSAVFKIKPNKKYKISVTPVFGDKVGKATVAAKRWSKTTKIKKIKAGKKKVTISWKKVKGATKYQVLQYKNGKWRVVKTTKGTKATIKVGKKGTYKFKVRPMKGKYYGIRSNTKKGKAK